MVSFFADKLVDCIFIFVGVYVAFAFSECQENIRRKAELRFNIEQILLDLPDQPPEKSFSLLKAEKVRSKNGQCRLWISRQALHHYQAKDHLEVIVNRGLGTFLPSQNVLRRLINLYRVNEPLYKKRVDAFYARMNTEEFIKELRAVKDPNAACAMHAELSAFLEEKVNKDFGDIKKTDIVLRQLGYDIRKVLMSYGYKEPSVEEKPYTYFVDAKTGENGVVDIKLHKEEFNNYDPGEKVYKERYKKFLDKTNKDQE